ncbi:hypothetical protein QBC46DRAFT_374738 [Diplogelasinospora grovesii]|uniref:Hemerythrin-like domain-containing protein n=1 Tax=Diplogelasinospora grovesii TaxID=303347 RepID=A0AAN6NEX7_9PEZI|nr:hypothetical protein QBC46DRAFT_374738 [Diplogelasinospora grovesii]
MRIAVGSYLITTGPLSRLLLPRYNNSYSSYYKHSFIHNLSSTARGTSGSGSLHQTAVTGRRPVLSQQPRTMSSAAAAEAHDRAEPGVPEVEETGSTSAPEVSVSAEEGAAKPGEGSTSEPAPEPEPEPELPPLTPEQFRVYNRLADTMEYFHDHFRKSWRVLYSACESHRRPSGMTLRQFIDEGLSLVRYLEAHHNIEETYLYPLLARKMPEFTDSSNPAVVHRSFIKGGNIKRQRQKCELLRQHEEIHAGMDVFGDYLRRCKNRETELELNVLREKMDTWGDVLFNHLDQEVRDLGADKMRRVWSMDEMRAFPI